MSLLLQSWGDDELPCNVPDNSDIELSTVLNILSPRDEYLEYLEEIDDFEKEKQAFINELELANRDSAMTPWYGCKYEIITEKIQKNIEVRIIKKFNNFMIGSIDGLSNVYIPISLSNYVSVGELILCDIIYKPSGKNIWKAIYIHPKVEPIIVSINEVNENIALKLKVNHQNVGKMIGKNGNYIKKIGENYLKDNPQMIQYMGIEDTFPKFNIYNQGNHTYIEVYTKKELFYNTDKSFNLIKDIVMKLYV